MDPRSAFAKAVDKNRQVPYNIKAVFHGKTLRAAGGGADPQDADMAQLAEQLICNQQVEGSSPPIGFMVP